MNDTFCETAASSIDTLAVPKARIFFEKYFDIAKYDINNSLSLRKIKIVPIDLYRIQII